MARLPKSIAFVTDARAWGGAEVYLMQLLDGVRAKGLTPRVFCADWPEADAWIEELKVRGYQVERFRPTKEFNPLGYIIARRLLRGFELVHINKTHPRNSLPAVVAARHSGARVVVATEHLALRPDSHIPMGRRIITFLVRCTNRLLDRTIAVSELSRDQLIDHYGIPPERIVAIRNGIDVAGFDEDIDESGVRAELGFSDDDSIALLIGRFAARKGHTFALRALTSAMERVSGLRMIFAGDGELEEELKAEARELGLADRVLFAGFRRDVPRLLAASDALILPSESECLPLVILEAMAARRPVIATDVGGISEAVEDGRTGLLVKPRDAVGLSDALVEVLGDRERGRSMGLEGRRKVEAEFSLEACAAAVFDVYSELLARGDLKQ
ncbi:MAG TPA: glycosyltransferase family 4 protein [bacterium]|nr:glycosyltransferase family 4 protein [bacterium]